ncbi:CRAL-TRIO domain-containing protein [Chytriomyces sp. MP71]|nr:CRAL-TRIO domain-containing protein [Chytriomyces sp. MP71]
MNDCVNWCQSKIRSKAMAPAILNCTFPVHTGPLTFTEEEQQSVNSLHAQVPALIESLEGIVSEAERHLLLAWATKATAHRYLIATKWKLESAAAKLKATLQWRNEFKPSEIPAEEVEPEAVCGKGFVSGFDKHGRPILYGIGRLDNTKTWDRSLRFSFYLIEKAIRLMPEGVEKLTIVLDNNGIGLMNSPPVSFMLSFVAITEKHYPERLGCAILSSPSWYVWGLYNIVAPFLDPVIKAKIYFAKFGRDEASVAPTVEQDQASKPQSSGWSSYLGLREKQPAANTEADNSKTVAGSVWGAVFGSSGADAKSTDNTENTAGTGGWTDILTLIDADQLPVAFGGAHDFEYEHATYWRAIDAV